MQPLSNARTYGSQITISEVSVDAEKESWFSGEDHTLKVRIKVPSSGSVHFLVRATFSDYDWNIIDRDPWFSTGYRDEQRHYGYRYTVDVVQPNSPSNTPYNEESPDNATNVSVNPKLDWSCTDPDGDKRYYTVYLEKNDSTPNNIVKDDETGSYCYPPTLEHNIHYYWKVVADDHKDGKTTSPTWDFWTGFPSTSIASITT